VEQPSQSESGALSPAEPPGRTNILPALPGSDGKGVIMNWTVAKKTFFRAFIDGDFGNVFRIINLSIRALR